MKNKLLLAAVVIQMAISCSLAQTSDSAKNVYDNSEQSVFLVYLNDSSGSPEALGSAFLVAPKTLVTNAHVVKEGTPVLAVGPVRIPVTVVSRDATNDLAVLSVNVDLTSHPLPLSSSKPSPGERIYAIGNPEGLEKTISEGLISGIRSLGTRTLLQITSPISHGSSGGPILDSDGRVVGVAVGMLEDGQNLNFAVPVEYVRLLLTAKPQPGRDSVPTTLTEISTLADKLSNDAYSQDETSDYQQDLNQLTSSGKQFLAMSAKPEDLEKFACVTNSNWNLLDEGVESAQKLYQIRSTQETAAFLAYFVLKHAESVSFDAALAQDGSPEKSKAMDAKKSDLSAISRLSQNFGQKAAENPLFAFVLASAREMNEDYASAIRLNQNALEQSPTVCGAELADEIYRDLISDNDHLGRPAEAEKWFRRLAADQKATAWDWDSEGDRRDAAGDLSRAADAYENAANANQYLSIDYCWAAQESFRRASGGDDGVLTDGRKCIDASVKATSEAESKKFAERLPIVYRAMATVLESRGVHQPALEYIKQSLAAKADDPYALDEEAKIFGSLERYPECVAAAQAAISASDGKFPWMQFELGNCYFDESNWSQAAASFRISADADKTDAASAFNLALCFLRQGFRGDAKIWADEALARNPTGELRGKVLDLLKGL